MTRKEHVLVIGAGAAGLIAATKIAGHYGVTIIEARDRPGGRIHTIGNAAGEGALESGAEFVHGDLPLTNTLIREAGLTKIKVEGAMYRKENGRWKKQDEMIEGWDEMLALMKNLPVHVTMQEFMDKHYPPDKHPELRKQMTAYVQGFDLASVGEVSARSLYDEWSAEEEQYRVKEGYSSIINYLVQQLTQKGGDFHFSERATGIHWSANKVTVSTESGREFNGTRLLGAVPVSILGNPALLPFYPAIPLYTQSASAIGFGPVVKILFEFSEPFWKKDTGFIFADEAIPTWWTQNPIKNGLLTGWAGGPDAQRIFNFRDDEIKDVGLKCLANIYDISSENLRTNLLRSNVFNWIRDKNCLGAYSYARPASKEARKTLSQPVDNTLFFAGEGIFDGAYPGTVEAAFHTGMRAASDILASFR